MISEWRRRQQLLRAAVRIRRPRAARVRPGALPGALPPPEGAERPRISVLTFTREEVAELEAKDVDEALAAAHPAGVTWINVDGLGEPAVLSRLGEHFGLHPLAVEDALNVPQRPKVERYPAHFFIVLRMIRQGAEMQEEEQVSVFFGQDFVVTVQERAGGDVFNPVRDAIRLGRGRVRESGADYLAYLLLDAVVDGYFPVLEGISGRAETLEVDAIAAAGQETLFGIQRLRHDLLTLRRAVWPIREEIAILQRDDSPLIGAETRVFLRDAYDHALQALEVVESLREMAATVMEVYLSAQNQRLNSVMKVLTVIATLFIPLTFIASIYGMNFEFMPELHWRYGYAFALGLMAVATAVMVLYFRRRGWW
ncbi:MAG: magnesium/cobalt transporter CorA [Candidatus Rokubacteria bacterium]|nr:magnesium/cobalt transporter CorA [Candidatus Rokubacteria bacterium]